MKKITAYTREDFRKWLAKYHDRELKVEVLLHKRHTGKRAPSHRELLEEAICFGWIDTTLNRLDEDRYIRHFSRRNKNSRWSDNTLRYARELIANGKMTEPGLAFYREGLAKPTHDHGIPKNPDMPSELKRALSKDATAKRAFEKLAPSTKKMHYRFILRAKRPETKVKYVRQILSPLGRGLSRK